MNGKDFASGQIIIPFSILSKSISGIVIYILLQGRCSFGHVLITYNINGEINHNNLSTHNRDKSQDNRYI
jgi:hypothetical protein